MRWVHWVSSLATGCVVAACCVLVALAPSARAQSAPKPFPFPGLPLPQRQEQQRLDIQASLDFLRDRDARLCYLPPPTDPSDIDVHRSLVVHDRATLDALGGELFSLERTLGQIASQVNAATGASTTSALGMFRQFWDTQNAAPGVVPTPSSPHCSDNGGTLNGFPITCRGTEGNEAVDSSETTMNAYHPIALINRIDLAHEGWRNCGEYRIIYARTPGNPERLNFMIFEAVLPNPKPGCRESCMAVARYWRDLSTINDPAVRAQRLSDFYYRTDPVTSAPIVVSGLESFRPVVHVDHYSAKGVTSAYGSSGSGQIRTNEFLRADPRHNPWVLREYKTVIDCGPSPCRFDMVPTMVKVNPYGELWNEDRANGASPDVRAQALQTSVVDPSVVASLADGHLVGINYPVDLALGAAQSTAQRPLSIAESFPDDYREQFHAATGGVSLFRNNLAAAAMAQGLTADQLIRRAQTQSCGGCHKPRTFGLDQANSIGPVLTPQGTITTSWPLDGGFFHIDPHTSTPSGLANPVVFGSGVGHALSPALADAFLPVRKRFLVSQLNMGMCACKHSFRLLAADDARLVLELQEEVFKAVLPEVDALREASFALRGNPKSTPSERQALEAQAKALEDTIDDLLAEQLASSQVLPEEPTLTAQPLVLDAASISGGKPELEAAARQEAILDIVSEEPPRRTVTGDFTAH
ncbi:MAG: hypothetical protein ACOY0T_05640 [Myxococcota bacterium]